MLNKNETNQEKKCHKHQVHLPVSWSPMEDNKFLQALTMEMSTSWQDLGLYMLNEPAVKSC